MYMVFRSAHLCSIPAFFYPTTVLMVDDDEAFLKAISLELSNDYKTITFSNANEAVDYLTKKGTAIFRGRTVSTRLKEGVFRFREEAYNPKRFEDVLVSVIDYDMPNKSGFDVMRHVGLADYYQRHEHSYILLTAKKHGDFDKTFAEHTVVKNFISKSDENHFDLLLRGINRVSTLMFQGVSHEVASILAKDCDEQTNFLNDTNFLPIFNAYLKEHEICEGYLFDKQGSLLFLDNHAKLYWLFVRNEKGIVNSIERAKQYGAPPSVINALETRTCILSLYEKEDFESRDHINWDSYLLSANLFKDHGTFTDVFNHCPSDYYYAFTQDFPEHGIDRGKMLSYADFLKG